MTGFHAQTIVVPVDFSDLSFEAVDAALGLADDPSNIHVVHVLPDLEPREADIIRYPEPEVRKAEATKAIRSRLADSKYSGIQVTVDLGEAGQHIVAFAESIKAGLIVIPSLGRTGIKRLLMGSVAERVVRLAHCPVLVLRK